MLRIAICDDEAAHLERTKSLIERYAKNCDGGESIMVYPFSRGATLVNAVAATGGFDIYVLDVVMPEMSGIDTGIKIREYDTGGKIIYLTSTADYGVESYIPGAFYYLLKTADTKELFSVLDRAVAEIQKNKAKSVKVKTQDKTYLIHFDDIVYVELKKKNLLYHLKKGMTVESVSQRESFASCVSPLTEDSRFTLVGASTCLNLFYVTAVDKDSVTFKSGEQLYLPKKLCSSLRSEWLDFWFEEDK